MAAVPAGIKADATATNTVDGLFRYIPYRSAFMTGWKQAAMITASLLDVH